MAWHIDTEQFFANCGFTPSMRSCFLAFGNIWQLSGASANKRGRQGNGKRHGSAARPNRCRHHRLQRKPLAKPHYEKRPPLIAKTATNSLSQWLHKMRPLAHGSARAIARGFIFASNIRDLLAEREGFEPPIGLHLCRISSAVHSTTLPPLQEPQRASPRSGGVLGEDGGPDKARGANFRSRVKPTVENGGTARRDKNRRSRVASLKLWPGSAASLASLSDDLTVAVRAQSATPSAS
jgi:hypothetical protein